MIQNYVTLIAALAAGVCSIIATWRGQKTDNRVTALAAAVAPRPPVFVPVQAPPTDFGFDGVISGATAPRVSFGDILKYYGAFSELSDFFSSLHGQTVGVVVYTPVLKTKINGRHAKIGPVPVVFED